MAGKKHHKTSTEKHSEIEQATEYLLQETLQPVRPAGTFMQSLRQKLSETQHAIGVERERRAGRLTNVLGTVVWGIAVVTIIARLFGSVFLLILHLIRQRKPSSAT
jgi:hypothetical protein